MGVVIEMQLQRYCKIPRAPPLERRVLVKYAWHAPGGPLGSGFLRVKGTDINARVSIIPDTSALPYRMRYSLNGTRYLYQQQQKQRGHVDHRHRATSLSHIKGGKHRAQDRPLVPGTSLYFTQVSSICIIQ
jgi:hypothetical protein